MVRKLKFPRTNQVLSNPTLLAGYVGDIVDMNSYINVYDTLINDGGHFPLRVIASEEELRPITSEILVEDHAIGSMMDAYDRDRWWTGKVVDKVGVEYLVYFEATYIKPLCTQRKR